MSAAYIKAVCKWYCEPLIIQKNDNDKNRNTNFNVLEMLGFHYTYCS